MNGSGKCDWRLETEAYTFRRRMGGVRDRLGAGAPRAGRGNGAAAELLSKRGMFRFGNY